MSKGIIGKAFTFTVLFVDPLNTPIDPLTPTIEVFYFNDAGTKVYIVPIATPLPPVVPAEVGRYSYTLIIPGSLDPRYELYGMMRGTDPISGFPLVAEQQVDLFFQDGTGTGCPGLRASFVKAGVC